eukprot:365891-Chlamydomonas_euryale.AAC.12
MTGGKAKVWNCSAFEALFTFGGDSKCKSARAALWWCLRPASCMHMLHVAPFATMAHGTPQPESV